MPAFQSGKDAKSGRMRTTCAAMLGRETVAYASRTVWLTDLQCIPLMSCAKPLALLAIEAFLRSVLKEINPD